MFFAAFQFEFSNLFRSAKKIDFSKGERLIQYQNFSSFFRMVHFQKKRVISEKFSFRDHIQIWFLTLSEFKRIN